MGTSRAKYAACCPTKNCSGRTSAIVTGTLLLLGVVTAVMSSSLAGTLLGAPIDSVAVLSHQS